MADGFTESLVAEFSAKLDAALIYAIASDCDETPESQAAVRATLKALASEDSTPANAYLPTLEPGYPFEEDGTNSSATGTTDDDEGERAFRNWSLQDNGSTPSSRDEDLRSFNADTLDPITFLKSLFPKRQTIEIDLAYQDANGDIEAAIETLLTEDFLLREEEQEYFQLALEGADQLDGRKRKTGQRKHGKQTVNITSARRGISPNVASSAITQQERPNAWVQTDSTILYLSTLLSVPSAISRTLDQVEGTFESLDDAEAKIGQLKEIFPDESSTTLKRCLCGTRGDLTKAVQLIGVLREIHQSQGAPLFHELLLNNPNKPKGSALASHKQPEPLPPKRLALAATSQAFPAPPTTIECASLAWTLRNKRDDAYRSAARTWQSKSALGSSGVAAYWAEHGRQLDRQAREWELRAARATVEDRRKQARSLQSIDLHGLNVNQALTVTQESLLKWWNTPSSPSTLTIVTGAGKHSANQNPVLLPAIRKLLEREGYDWKYEGDRWHRGSMIVFGMQGRRKDRAF